MEHALDVLLAIREYLNQDLSHYGDDIVDAFSAVDPVFTRPQYADFFWHCASTMPGWLPQVVLANALAESQGSAKLLSLWETVDYNRAMEDKILRHAKDESRHSRLFLKVASLAFPSSIDSAASNGLIAELVDVRRTQYSKSGRRISQNVLIDHLVRMNTGEIRTRIHMHLLSPLIYTFAPQENKAKVKKILTGLVLDEVRHIGYTAKLM